MPVVDQLKSTSLLDVLLWVTLSDLPSKRLQSLKFQTRALLLRHANSTKMTDPRNCGALMNGLIRQLFYGDKEITSEFLQNEIFPNLKEDDFNILQNKYKGLLKVRILLCYRPLLVSLPQRF